VKTEIYEASYAVHKNGQRLCEARTRISRDGNSLTTTYHCGENGLYDFTEFVIWQGKKVLTRCKTSVNCKTLVNGDSVTFTLAEVM